MVHVSSSHKSCEVKAKDGRVDTMDCVRSFYHKIAIFIVLGLKDVIVF
jgi:hypothetical protein